MSSNDDGVDRGTKVNVNAGIGQQRVDEPSPGPLQKTDRPPSAGGPGAGAGDDASGKTPAEDQVARSGPAVYDK